MAGSDSHNQLRSELEAEKMALEQTKRETETSKKELEIWKRIVCSKDVILSIKSELMAAKDKNDDALSLDVLIAKIRKVNEIIRKFRENLSSLSADNSNQASSSTAGSLASPEQVPGYWNMMYDVSELMDQTEKGLTDLENYDEIQKHICSVEEKVLKLESEYDELLKEAACTFPR